MHRGALESRVIDMNISKVFMQNLFPINVYVTGRRDYVDREMFLSLRSGIDVIRIFIVSLIH